MIETSRRLPPPTTMPIRDSTMFDAIFEEQEGKNDIIIPRTIKGIEIASGII